MNYYNTVPFVILDRLDVKNIKDCVFVIPSNLVLNINIERLLKLQSLNAFVIVKNTVDSSINELILFSENYLKFDDKPFIIDEVDIVNVNQEFTDEFMVTQLNKKIFSPTFYSLEKIKLHPRISKNPIYSNILDDYYDFNKLLLDNRKLEIQTEILEDSLKANKIESIKEIRFYKTEMIKRESWAKKNPELSFWELIKYLGRKILKK